MMRLALEGTPITAPAQVEPPVYVPFTEAAPPVNPLARVELAAIPGALLLGLLLNATSAGRFLVSASAEMEMHELGHATALWFAGRLAIPLPMVTLGSGEGRSLLTFAVLATFLGLTLRASLREGLKPLAVFCGALLGLELLMTAALTGPRLDEWVKFAGVGGEFWLSALLIGGFHARLPAAARWPASRWFFLIWGALAFMANARRWWLGEIPWGSFWGGDGDMDTLRDLYGHGELWLTRSYRAVGIASALGIASTWVVSNRSELARLRASRS